MSVYRMVVQRLGGTLKLPILNEWDTDKPVGSSTLDGVKRIIVNTSAGHMTYVPESEANCRPQATRRCRSYGPYGFCTCSECGVEIDTSDAFCRQCGASFGKTEYERVES